MLRCVAFSVRQNFKRLQIAIPNAQRLGYISSSTLSNHFHHFSPVHQNILRTFSSLPEHSVVGLPALSPTMETGTIARWNVKEGDQFSPGDILCEVQTDKATVDFEAQDEGIVAKILVESGAKELKLGEPIMVTVSEKDDISAFKDYALDSINSNNQPQPQPTKVSEPKQEPSKSEKPPIQESFPKPQVNVQQTFSQTDRIFASPLAKKLALEKGFSLQDILGTGPNGRIIAADVQEYVPSIDIQDERVSTESHAPLTPFHSNDFIDWPVSNDAKIIAARLAQTKKSVPHYYLTIDINLDTILKLRDELNSTLGEESQLSLNDMLLKAAALSMKEVPTVNASWMESFVRQYKNVDINVIVGIGDGLVAPVIRNVERKGLATLSDEIKSVYSGVQTNSLPDETFQCGTFSVINVGMFGVKSIASIVHTPQACMLGLGVAEQRVIPNEDENAEQIYKIATMFTATLSCDHRVVDGAVGAQWLATFKNIVQNPLKMLL